MVDATDTSYPIIGESSLFEFTIDDSTLEGTTPNFSIITDSAIPLVPGNTYVVTLLFDKSLDSTTFGSGEIRPCNSSDFPFGAFIDIFTLPVLLDICHQGYTPSDITTTQVTLQCNNITGLPFPDTRLYKFVVYSGAPNSFIEVGDTEFSYTTDDSLPQNIQANVSASLIPGNTYYFQLFYDAAQDSSNQSWVPIPNCDTAGIDYGSFPVTESGPAPPCFVKDTLIRIKGGYKAIQDLTESDYVFDKMNEYYRVQKIIKTEMEDDLIKIKKNAIEPNKPNVDTICTLFHRFEIDGTQIEAQHIKNDQSLKIQDRDAIEVVKTTKPTTVYHVLLENSWRWMVVHNLYAESLDPNSPYVK